jgi:hypothetical protein
MRRWFILTGLVIGIGCAGVAIYQATRPDADAMVSPVSELDLPLAADDASFGLAEAIDLAESGLRNLNESVVDYSATMLKQERIDGKLTDVNAMFVKIQNPGRDASGEPARALRVYLKFLQPESIAGREVIWCQDRYDQKLMAHEAGFLGILTVALDPKGPIAMMGNRHSIDHIGLAYLMEELIRYGRKAPPGAKLSVQKYEDHEVHGQKCRLIRIESESVEAGLGFARIDIAVDLQKLIPLHLSTYDWPLPGQTAPQLIESYTYYDVVLNPGLQELDFDTKNPEYKFP